MKHVGSTDEQFMRLALKLARRGYGATSPNPMVGAVLVKAGRIIGRGWHTRAGAPHAEIEALNHARRAGEDPRGATLYVTLEPCSTHGRTPPCTDAIRAAGIARVVAGATDPNPKHRGNGFRLLRRAGIAVTKEVLAPECEHLNEAFNHWILRHAPLVTVKAAMTLDGKIATASGESKWITGEKARAHGMSLRQGADAILVGINTILADDPGLTLRSAPAAGEPRTGKFPLKPRGLRRIILDSQARTPLNAKVVTDHDAALTTIVVTRRAPKKRVAALASKVRVLVAPTAKAPRASGPAKAPEALQIDLPWLLERLGKEEVTSLLVEGGGEVNASFLLQGLAQRIAFFYAPLILGGRSARPAVAGPGAASLREALTLTHVEWRRFGPDWLLAAQVASNAPAS